MYARCLVKKKRARSYESSVLISNASDLLESGKISVNEFLDSIAKMKAKQYSKTVSSSISTSNKRTAISSDDESDDENEPSTSQPSTSQKSAKRARNAFINPCRSCKINESNVILFPCTHTAICFECWTKKLIQNDEYCILCNAAATNAKRF